MLSPELFFRLLDKAAAPVSRNRRLACLNEGLDLELTYHLFLQKLTLAEASLANLLRSAVHAGG